MEAMAAPEAGAAESSVAVGPADAAEAEAFFDGLMLAQLRHLDNVGATVCLVRGGEILFAKGYGWADLQAGVAVDPEETLFRIGSVTKLFVWTAVMQLVERGELDLDTDIGDYLVDVDFHDVWDEPVTLAHLMTHSPGFEDRVVGLFSRDPESLRSLEEILSSQTPKQVRPPGDQPSYSNHGTAVAAMVVEAVSGQPFIEYVQEHILDPLGMTHTSLAQPLPAELATKMSKGYSHAGDHFEEEEFELVPLYPAGTASASATDMGRLMIALLQDGRFGEERILGEETARRMRQPLLEVDPAVNPSPHGFMDMSVRGVRIVGHGGDTFWFHTMFALFPEHDLGLFVSYNTDEGSGGRTPVMRAFLDRYFAPAPRPGAAPEDFSDRADRYTGEYRGNRFARTTLAKVAGLVQAFRVDVTDEGELLVMGSRWVETAPRVFTSNDGEESLVFIEGEDGVMSHFYLAQFPIMTFERVPPSEGRGLHAAIAVIAGGLFVLTLLAWPAGWLIRRWFGVRDPRAPRISWLARAALWLASALLLSTVVAFVALAGDPSTIAFGEVGGVKAILVLPLLALAPFAVAVVAAWRLWRTGGGTRVGRLLYSLTVLATVAFYWQLSVWNLLGFKL